MAKSPVPLLVSAGIIALMALSNNKKTSSKGSSALEPLDPNRPTPDPNGSGVEYLEFVTPGASPDEELPMVIIFHSRSTPESSLEAKGRRWANTNLTGPARIIVPLSWKTLSSGNLSWFEKAAATTDQDYLAEEMADVAHRTAAFINEVSQDRPTTSRPIVVGASQGGSMAYLMSSMYPELIDGAVAVSGWLPERLWTAQIAPTIAYHGDSDSIVPFGPTQKYWQALTGISPIGYQVFSVDANKTHGHYLSSDMSRQMIRAVNYLAGYRNTPPAGVGPQTFA